MVYLAVSRQQGHLEHSMTTESLRTLDAGNVFGQSSFALCGFNDLSLPRSRMCYYYYVWQQKFISPDLSCYRNKPEVHQSESQQNVYMSHWLSQQGVCSGHWVSKQDVYIAHWLSQQGLCFYESFNQQVACVYQSLNQWVICISIMQSIWIISVTQSIWIILYQSLNINHMYFNHSSNIHFMYINHSININHMHIGHSIILSMCKSVNQKSKMQENNMVSM